MDIFFISPELHKALEVGKVLSESRSQCELSRGFNLPALMELEGEWAEKEVADLRKFFLNWCGYLARKQLRKELREVLYQRSEETEAEASRKHREGTHDWYRAMRDIEAEIKRTHLTLIFSNLQEWVNHYVGGKDADHSLEVIEKALRIQAACDLQGYLKGLPKVEAAPTEPLQEVEELLEGMTLYQLGRWLAKS